MNPRPKSPLSLPQRRELEKLATDLNKDPLTVEDFDRLKSEYKIGLDKAMTNNYENMKATLFLVACAEKGNDALLLRLKNLGEEDMNVFLLANVDAALKNRGTQILSLNDSVKDALTNNKMEDKEITKMTHFFNGLRNSLKPISETAPTNSRPLTSEASTKTSRRF